MTFKNKFLLIGLVVVGLSLTPFVALTLKVGGVPSVIPEIIDDSLYYNARLVEVSQGHPLIGNPYFYEYREGIAPAFFMPDWFAAIPALARLPVNWTIILDTVLWVSIFYLLAVNLFQKLKLAPKQAVFASALMTLIVLWLLVRPVSMQIIFPFFLLTLITYFDWLERPESRRAQTFFALCVGLNFYLYSYSAQIFVILLFILLASTLWRKNFTQAKNIFKTGVLAIIFALPALYFLFEQVKNPYFWQTMTRLGLVSTRSIGGEALLCLGLVLVGIVLVQMSFEKGDLRRQFFISTGLSLGILSISNVVTDKDIELTIHVVRFVDLWFLILTGTALFNLKKTKYLFWILITLAVLRTGDLLYLSMNRLISLSKATPLEEIQPLLHFLNTSGLKESVVMADDFISAYIPIYTSEYVLFHPDGGMQLVPDSEVFERYSLSRVGVLTETELKDEMRLYRGVGPADHVWQTQNRLAKYCDLLKKVDTNLSCLSQVSKDTYYGQAYFDDLFKIYQKQVAPNPQALLSKYAVQYVVLDNEDKQFVLPQKLLGKIVYQDQRFTVYSLEK